MTETDHDKLAIVYHWPLYWWGDDEAPVHAQCDYCAITLWTNKPAHQTNLDELYRLVSDHIPDCTEAP